MTLAELKTGQRARIISVSGEDSITERMLEMGLTPGCEAPHVKVRLLLVIRWSLKFVITA